MRSRYSTQREHPAARSIPASQLKPGDVFILIEWSGEKPGTAQEVRTLTEPTVLLNGLVGEAGRTFVRYTAGGWVAPKSEFLVELISR